MTTAEESQDRPVPRLVFLPDELQEFLESVHIMAEDLRNGTYRLSEPEDCLVWDDITWTKACVVRPRMIGFPSEDLSEFEFKYDTPFMKEEWEFHLSREDLARIAGGAVRHLALYACANPVCGYMSSRERDRCPRCHLGAGADIRGPHSQRVLGVCPYCNGPLRALSAKQCRHCRMDWHDPDHPTVLE